MGRFMDSILFGNNDFLRHRPLLRTPEDREGFRGSVAVLAPTAAGINHHFITDFETRHFCSDSRNDTGSIRADDNRVLLMCLAQGKKVAMVQSGRLDLYFYLGRSYRLFRTLFPFQTFQTDFSAVNQCFHHIDHSSNG
ncbi:hypothetical protein SDC9_128435 [bioreactor metagenome]|uniref:Uncharacterized protein n=1 Tax=bioreactor metagenome TaxID=1076179 RepID=A0A645CXF2_9ZZZZ